MRLSALLLFVLSSACANQSSGSPSAAPSALLASGAAAPALRKEAHNGQVVDLSKPDGPTLVYFYPKDDTPGCTAEACAFRDAWEQYQTAGVMVIGVSSDSNESHRAFAEKYEFVFPLVADEDHAWANAFGVPMSRGGMTKRVSFLIDAQGKIAKVYPDVNPGIHSDEVLRDAAGL